MLTGLISNPIIEPENQMVESVALKSPGVDKTDSLTKRFSYNDGTVPQNTMVIHTDQDNLHEDSKTKTGDNPNVIHSSCRLLTNTCLHQINTISNDHNDHKYSRRYKLNSKRTLAI